MRRGYCRRPGKKSKSNSSYKQDGARDGKEGKSVLRGGKKWKQEDRGRKIQKISGLWVVLCGQSINEFQKIGHLLQVSAQVSFNILHAKTKIPRATTNADAAKKTNKKTNPNLCPSSSL